jgi:hypothetical protein
MIDPEVGEIIQIDRYVFNVDMDPSLLKRLIEGATVYTTFFILGSDGKTPAERVGIVPPPWLAGLVKIFREEARALGFTDSMKCNCVD